MLAYIIRRILMLIPILLLVSFIAFFVIELPPGDWVTTYVSQLRTSGIVLSDQRLSASPNCMDSTNRPMCAITNGFRASLRVAISAGHFNGVSRLAKSLANVFLSPWVYLCLP